MLGIFRNRPKNNSDLSWLKVDIHNHVLPGLDDGARNTDESLEMIRGLKELGFEKLYATPHIMQDHYPNTPERILQCLEEVREILKKEEIDIELHAAAEYMMDEYFELHLLNGNFLTLPDKKVLVEMSFLEAPKRLHEYLFELQTSGYKPILAHPERYHYLTSDPKQYTDLRERGCQFQVNLLSLVGAYGKGVQKLALKLIQNKQADYLGTDTHTAFHIKLLSQNIKGRIHKLNVLYQNMCL